MALDSCLFSFSTKMVRTVLNVQIGVQIFFRSVWQGYVILFMLLRGSTLYHIFYVFGKYLNTHLFS